jgi:hypothetical protein
MQRAKQTMPHAIFREIFYAEAAADTGNPFGEDAIKACIDANVFLEESGSDIDWSSGEPCANYGVDLAETEDWNVIIGLTTRGKVARVSRWHGPWTMTKPRIIATVGSVPTYCDATSLQSLLVQELASHVPNIQPYKFTSQTKQALVGSLIEGLGGRRLSYPAGLIPEELRSFEYVYKEGGRVEYHAREGSHDDCAVALALAWYARSFAGGGMYAYVEGVVAEQEKGLVTVRTTLTP